MLTSTFHVAYQYKDVPYFASLTTPSAHVEYNVSSSKHMIPCCRWASNHSVPIMRCLATQPYCAADQSRLPSDSAFPRTAGTSHDRQRLSTSIPPNKGPLSGVRCISKKHHSPVDVFTKIGHHSHCQRPTNSNKTRPILPPNSQTSQHPMSSQYLPILQGQDYINIDDSTLPYLHLRVLGKGNSGLLRTSLRSGGIAGWICRRFGGL
jgi:hypothetical protein